VTDRLDHQIAVLASAQHGVFTCAQALSLGATRNQVARRVQTGRWSPLAAGTYAIAGSPHTWRQQVAAAVLAAGGDAAASHCTAAALWGLPGFAEDGVEVSRLKSGSYRSPLAVVRRTGLLPAHHVLACDGIRTTTPARTIFDLAGSVHPKRAERALDNALARKLVSLGRIRATHLELAEHGRAGSALIGELLEARGAGYVAPDSGLESLFLERAAERGLPEPARQVWLGHDGEIIGRVDLCYRDRRIVIEVDSERHHRTLLDRMSDEHRDEKLRRAGWHVVRVAEEPLRAGSPECFAELERVLRRIA
jgi:hypothetical protein